MEILTYRRTQKTFHVHHLVVSDIIFIPSMNKALYKESQGTFSGYNYGKTDNDAIIKDSNVIYQQYLEGKEDYTVEFGKITDVKNCVVDDKIVYDAIEHAEIYKISFNYAKENINKLLGQEEKNG